MGFCNIDNTRSILSVIKYVWLRITGVIACVSDIKGVNKNEY